MDRQDRQEESDYNYYDQGDTSQIELKDGYIVRDGRMMTVNNGMTSVIKKETTLENGTVLAINGNYTTRDGKPVMLRDGEHMDSNGTIRKYQAKREIK